MYGSSFSEFDAVGSKNCHFVWNSAKWRLLGRSKSLKVTDFDTNREAFCDFLLLNNANLSCLAPFPSYGDPLVKKIVFHRVCHYLTLSFSPSARQHPGYGDCLEVKREYYQNCSVLNCVTQYSQSAAHLYQQFLQVKQIGFVTLGPLRCA